MNRLLKTLLFTLVLSQSLFGKIIETKKMQEILKDVSAHSLVVFDLDNTIMEAGQTLGSDQWFEYRITQLKNSGESAEVAVEHAVSDWEKINYKGTVRLVETVTPSIIKKIQDRGIPTMGLTARPASFLEKSLSQLRSLHVPIARRTVTDAILEIQDKDLAVFKEGVLSVGLNNKGTILVKLLNEIGMTPERVIFVDDKVKNVKNVDEALEAVSIPSFAHRYGAADSKVKAFDAKLADFELNYFQTYGKVLSDTEARKLMP